MPADWVRIATLRSRAWISASASIAGEISIASTSAPISAASQASTPLPQPISATRQPRCTPSMVSAARARMSLSSWRS